MTTLRAYVSFRGSSAVALAVALLPALVGTRVIAVSRAPAATCEICKFGTDHPPPPKPPDKPQPKPQPPSRPNNLVS